jgi:hypothetical protein
MYEFAFMVGGWAASYLVRSAVLLAVLGAVAWMSDRLLGRVGPSAHTGCGLRRSWLVWRCQCFHLGGCRSWNMRERLPEVRSRLRIA